MVFNNKEHWSKLPNYPNTYEYKGFGYFPQVVSMLQNILGVFRYIDYEKRIIRLHPEQVKEFFEL